MKKNQFLALIVLGLLVGGLGFYFYSKQKQSFTSSGFTPGQKVLKDFPLNDVAHLRIKQSSSEVNLERKGEIWTVKERWDYPANFSDLSEFLLKMRELKPVQDVEVGASQYGRLELNSPAEGSTNSGTLVEFKDTKEATLRSVVLGKKVTKESAGGMFGGGGEFPVGRYVLVPDSPAKVWLVSETFANIETKPEQWLSKDFIKVEKVKAVSVDRPGDTNDWKVARETESGAWTMADAKEGENFEASKASSLNYALSSPNFDDVANPELKPEESGLNEPTVAKLETFDGFIYTVNVGSKTNDEKLYIKVNVDGTFAKERTPGTDEKPEDKEKLDKEFKEKTDKLQEKLKKEQSFGKWTYLVSKWTVDSLLKDRKDFMAEKKPDETKEEKPAETSAAPKPVDSAAPPIEILPPELRNPPAVPLPEFKPAEKLVIEKPATETPAETEPK